MTTRLDQFTAAIPSLETAEILDLLYADPRGLHLRAASDVSGWAANGTVAWVETLEKAKSALRAEINLRFPKRSP